MSLAGEPERIPVTHWRPRTMTSLRLFLALADSIRDDEWSLTGNYPNVGGGLPGGERAMAMLFHYLSQHFQEHALEFDQWRTDAAHDRD
jgi:hypothetical protein